MEIRQRVFLMKNFLSEISQLFADSARSGFSIHGNSMAWSSLIYSSGITQFINLLHLLFMFGDFLIQESGKSLLHPAAMLFLGKNLPIPTPASQNSGKNTLVNTPANI